MAIGLAITGCSKKADVSSTTNTTTTADKATASTTTIPFGSLVTEGSGAGGKLVVCSDIPYPPLEFENPNKAGKYTGFDIDMMTYVAAQKDMSIDVKVTPFNGIIDALNSSSCDVIASALSITDERKQSIAYSDAYYDSAQSLVIRADEKDTIKDLASLKGKIIGVQTGTTGASYAKDNAKDATIKEFGQSDELFTALGTSDIDAILQDGPVNAYGVKQNPKYLYLQEFKTGEQYGFGIRKNDAKTLKLVNDGIAAAKADDTYKKLFDQYLTVAK